MIILFLFFYIWLRIFNNGIRDLVLKLMNIWRHGSISINNWNWLGRVLGVILIIWWEHTWFNLMIFLLLKLNIFFYKQILFHLCILNVSKLNLILNLILRRSIVNEVILFNIILKINLGLVFLNMLLIYKSNRLIFIFYWLYFRCTLYICYYCYFFVVIVLDLVFTDI